MNVSKVENPILCIFECLVVNVLCITMGRMPSKKFNPRSDEAIFLGYSSHIKAYKVFDKRTLCVEESVHVLFTNSLIENDA